MPPRTFLKFLEIWLQEPAPRGRNATTAFVQREASACAHTHTPHDSPECPVIMLCLTLTHTEKKALMTTLTQEAAFCTPVCTPKAFIHLCPPSDPPTDPCTHFTHSSHTSVSGCHKSAGWSQGFLGDAGH